LVRTSGKSKSAIAHDRGVSLEALRAWRQQAELDAGERHDGLTSEELAELRRWRREVKMLREEREILVQAAAFFLPSSLGRPTRCREEVRVRRAPEGQLSCDPPVTRLCRVLAVSPSGYWAWWRRVPSRRADANAHLPEHIVRIHSASRATYGAPKL